MSADFYYNPEEEKAVLKLPNENKVYTLQGDKVVMAKSLVSRVSFKEFLSNQYKINKFVLEINSHMPSKNIDFRNSTCSDSYKFSIHSTPRGIAYGLNVGRTDSCDYFYNRANDIVGIQACVEVAMHWGDFLKEIAFRSMYIKLIENWRKTNL